MKTNRTVIAEAVFINTKSTVNVKNELNADFKVDDYTHLPKMSELNKYLSEITQQFYEERRARLGREYSVSSVTQMYEAYHKKPRYIFLVKVKAMSTTLKAKPVIGYKTQKQLLKPSKFYELRFLVYIDLTNYLANSTLTALKKDLSQATCYYDCNCMSFHYHGIRYRASLKNWALYKTTIPDPVQRVRFGMNSRVCKHIGSFSTDLLGFAPQLKIHIDKLI